MKVILGKHGRKHKAKPAIIDGEDVWFLENKTKDFVRNKIKVKAYTDEYYEAKEKEIIENGPSQWDDSFIEERPTTFLELKRELLSVEEYHKLEKRIRNEKT